MDVSAVKKNSARCIGAGAQGVVYQGFDAATGKLVAIKEVALPHDVSEVSEVVHGRDSSSTSSTFGAGDERVPCSFPLLEDVISEIALMRHVRHPNVVAYYGARRSDENPAVVQIVTELVSGGSLSALISRYGQLREAVARQYTRDVLLGLHHLHERCRIIHRDLKPCNVLLSPEGVCKIVDFGASKLLLEGATLLKTCIGTANYIAPEVLEGKPYDSSVDVWSLGCCTFEMLTGKMPWNELQNPMAVMFRVASVADSRPQLPDHVHVSAECRDFLDQCFTRDTIRRPTAAALLHHPWILAGERGEVANQKRGSPGPHADGAGGAGGATSVDKVSLSGSISASESPRSTSLSGGGGSGAAMGAAAAAPTDDEADFFPGRSRTEDLKFVAAVCDICAKQIALFSCDQCRSRGESQWPSKFCAGCWDKMHAHTRAASHLRAPLLVAAGKPAPSERRRPGAFTISPSGASPASSPSAAAGTRTSNGNGVLLASGDFVDFMSGAGEQSEWECGRCTYLNDGPVTECAVCGHVR